jgi:L-ribulose-5-phosphate 3-epimerase
MQRRTFLAASASAAAALLLPPSASYAGPLQGKVRKCLKWNMVKDRSLPLADAFSRLRECGYDGLEPSVSDVDDAAAWKKASDDSGLVIDCVVHPTTNGIEAALDLCRELGGDSILVVCGYDPNRPYWDSYRETQDAIKSAADHAEKQNVKILIENVWATFLISPLDMQRYVDEIDHPFVGVHFDIGNVMRWGLPEHWIQVLGPRIRKLDLKEYDLKVAYSEGMIAAFNKPVGEGTINWEAVRNELANMDYQGWCAAEVSGGDWDYLKDVADRMDNVLGLT